MCVLLLEVLNAVCCRCNGAVINCDTGLYPWPMCMAVFSEFRHSTICVCPGKSWIIFNPVTEPVNLWSISYTWLNGSFRHLIDFKQLFPPKIRCVAALYIICVRPYAPGNQGILRYETKRQCERRNDCGNRFTLSTKQRFTNNTGGEIVQFLFSSRERCLKNNRAKRFALGWVYSRKWILVVVLR